MGPIYFLSFLGADIFSGEGPGTNQLPFFSIYAY